MQYYQDVVAYYTKEPRMSFPNQIRQRPAVFQKNKQTVRHGYRIPNHRTPTLIKNIEYQAKLQ